MISGSETLHSLSSSATLREEILGPHTLGHDGIMASHRNATQRGGAHLGVGHRASVHVCVWRSSVFVLKHFSPKRHVLHGAWHLTTCERFLRYPIHSLFQKLASSLAVTTTNVMVPMWTCLHTCYSTTAIGHQRHVHHAAAHHCL